MPVPAPAARRTLAARLRAGTAAAVAGAGAAGVRRRRRGARLRAAGDLGLERLGLARHVGARDRRARELLDVARAGRISSGEAKLEARPLAAARAVRPTRWT